MIGFVLRRLAVLVPLLFGITFFSFVLGDLSCSDPAEVSIRVNAMVPTPELIAQTRHELGLDRPLLERYAGWLGKVVHGDFGRSFVTRLPVAQSLAEAFPATLILAVAALGIILTVSVSTAVLSVALRDTVWDALVRGFIFLTSSMPAFWSALLLIWLFSVKLDLLPTSGMRGASSIVLPAATLSLAYIGTYVRLIRTEMLQALRRDWVLFARARGLSEGAILVRVLRNSFRGAAAGLGMSIPKLIAGAFVVETIFAWPGVGRLCVEAVFNRDLPIIQAYALMMAVLFSAFNLASELFLLYLDPAERHLLEAGR